MSIVINNGVNPSSDPTLQNRLKAFKKLAADLQISESVRSTLNWDRLTYMPQAATAGRASQMSFLARQSHNTLISRKMHGLIDYLEANSGHLNRADQALLREIQSRYKREKNIPGFLVQAFAKRVVKAQDLRIQAYDASDFNTFAPALEKLVSIKQQMAKHMGYEKSPYDALLDVYEPGMTTEKLDKIFKRLKDELVPLIRKINALPKPDTSFLHKIYDHAKQISLSEDLFKHIGFDSYRGRWDEADQPISHGILTNDVRLNIGISDDSIFRTIANVMHEGGHGLYYQGLDPSLEQTPLFDASSLGMDESQARLYEAIVGQGLPFWKYYFPKLQELFPENLKDVKPEEFYRAINNVVSSAFWDDSDELTYNLHIMVRYETEKALIEGTLPVKDAPKAWNEKVKEYLGVTPDDDVYGPLENSHWSDGEFGYLPLYTLGNAYAAQIYNTLKKEIPDIEEQFTEGNMNILKEWLVEQIYKYGKVETPDEILQRVTGESLNIEHYIHYIKNKYSKLYNLAS